MLQVSLPTGKTPEAKDRHERARRALWTLASNPEWQTVVELLIAPTIENFQEQCTLLPHDSPELPVTQGGAQALRSLLNRVREARHNG